MTTLSHAPVEIPLAADRGGPAPLVAQIVAQLRAALADGQFAAGDRLPSTRALAVSLGVSRTVVTTAYAQLFAEGWLEVRHGSGTYVAPGAPAPGAPVSGAPAAGPAAGMAGPDLRRLPPGSARSAGMRSPARPAAAAAVSRSPCSPPRRTGSAGGTGSRTAA